jgi:hypothetical protein
LLFYVIEAGAILAILREYPDDNQAVSRSPIGHPCLCTYDCKRARPSRERHHPTLALEGSESSLQSGPEWTTDLSTFGVNISPAHTCTREPSNHALNSRASSPWFSASPPFFVRSSCLQFRVIRSTPTLPKRLMPLKLSSVKRAIHALLHGGMPQVRRTMLLCTGSLGVTC